MFESIPNIGGFAPLPSVPDPNPEESFFEGLSPDIPFDGDELKAQQDEAKFRPNLESLSDYVANSPHEDFSQQLEGFSNDIENNPFNLTRLIPIILISKLPQQFAREEIRKDLRTVFEKNRNDLCGVFWPFLQWGTEIECIVNDGVKVDDKLRLNFTALICKLGFKNAIKKLVDVQQYINTAGVYTAPDGEPAKCCAVKDILVSQCPDAIRSLMKMRVGVTPLLEWYVNTAGEVATTDGIAAKRSVVKYILATHCSYAIKSLIEMSVGGTPFLEWYVNSAGDVKSQIEAARYVLKSQWIVVDENKTI